MFTAFHPFGVDKWVVSCNQMSALVAPPGECLRRKGLVWMTGQVVCSLAAYHVFPCKMCYIRIPGFSFKTRTCLAEIKLGWSRRQYIAFTNNNFSLRATEIPPENSTQTFAPPTFQRCPQMPAENHRPWAACHMSINCESILHATAVKLPINICTCYLGKNGKKQEFWLPAITTAFHQMRKIEVHLLRSYNTASCRFTSVITCWRHLRTKMLTEDVQTPSSVGVHLRRHR